MRVFIRFAVAALCGIVAGSAESATLTLWLEPRFAKLAAAVGCP